MQRVALVALLSSSLALASYCGESMIPYSFEVLPDGQPVLGCARPTCFGWAPNGRPHSNQASFYRVHGSADGFSREDREFVPPFGLSDPRSHQPQIAMCQTSFSSSSCPDVNSWVGGVAPLLNVSMYPTVVRCCSYDPLRQSEDRGVATVGGGQIVVGGEVLSNGVQYAFDYISDLAKYFHSDGSVKYDISIRRFACADLQSNIEREKIVKEDPRYAPQHARAFQEANLAVNTPLAPPQQGQVIETRDFEENAVIEEIVREEGVQLPPGTNFAPAQPPAPLPPVAVQQPYYYYPSSLAYQGGQLCFSADMEVSMADGSTKRMDELAKDDMVLTVASNRQELDYLPVKFWLHRVPEKVVEFYQIETENKKSIKLTALHYIYKGDCKSIGEDVSFYAVSQVTALAQDIREGDCLYTVEEGKMRESRVIGVKKVVGKGIYAPMTSNGRLIVNGVYASCHSVVRSNYVQDTFFSVVEGFHSMVGHLFSTVSSDTIELPFGLTMLRETFEWVSMKGMGASF